MVTVPTSSKPSGSDASTPSAKGGSPNQDSWESERGSPTPVTQTAAGPAVAALRAWPRHAGRPAHWRARPMGSTAREIYELQTRAFNDHDIETFAASLDE